MEAYDEVGLIFPGSGSTKPSFLLQDATLAVDLLVSLKNCNGRIAGTVHLRCCLLASKYHFFLSNRDVSWRSLGAPHFSCSYSVPKLTYDDTGVPGKTTILHDHRYFFKFKTQGRI